MAAATGRHDYEILGGGHCVQRLQTARRASLPKYDKLELMRSIPKWVAAEREIHLVSAARVWSGVPHGYSTKRQAKSRIMGVNLTNLKKRAGAKRSSGEMGVQQ